jgi:hypothetical protein
MPGTKTVHGPILSSKTGPLLQQSRQNNSSKKKKRQQAHDTSRVIWYSLRNIAIVHSHKIDSFVCRYKLFGCLWRAS